jgi:integrase
MTRKQSPPKLGNNGGFAYVRINSKRTYLGKFGSAEAERNYTRCIAEWATSTPGISPEIGTITVNTLMTAFLEHIRHHTPPHYASCCAAADVVLQLYGGTMVSEFTPKRLAAVQYQITKTIGKRGKPYSRQYCNALTNRIKQAFRWGVAQEFVSTVTADALKHVPALQQGRTTAPETTPRLDISAEAVKATLPYLLPTVAAMVQVQRLAVMRPNEVCRMRVGDIDRTRKDGVWIYLPPKHKNTWRGFGKAIPLGKPEQELILPYLVGKTPEQAVFSPKTALLEKREKDSQRRKSKLTPSQVKRAAQHAAHPKRIVREHYSSVSYAIAVSRAIEIANRTLPDDQKIPNWTPYQLRHAGITELVFANDGNLDVARAVAGHLSASMTKIYNHADLRIAVEAAKKRGVAATAASPCITAGVEQ